MEDPQHMVTLVAKNKDRAIQRLSVQHVTRDRQSSINTVSEANRFVHNEDVRARGNLNHRPPPSPHRDDRRRRVSSV